MKIRSRHDSSHVLWEGEATTLRGGVESAIASGANLSGADLSDANLSGADLSYANLSDANLSGANLRGADLRYANLSDANLSDANLSGADLRYANLRGADLRYANLSDANLSGANLSGADLTHQPRFVRLPVGDPRGYDCVAQWDGEQWIIRAGCRRFTVTDAVAHWGNDYEGDRAIGDRYLFGIGCLTGVEPPK